MKKNWKLGIRKNSAVVAVITLLLVVAVYLNWSYSRDFDPDDTGAALATTSAEENAALTAEGAETLSDAKRFADNEWTLQTEKDTAAPSGAVTQLSEYFSNARLSRQQSKDEALNILQTTLADANSSSDAKTSAETAIAALAANAISESRSESLVIAKGFDDCVAIIDGKTVSVVASPPEDGLISSDVAKIKDIVIAETQVSADKIRIIEAGA